MTISSFELHLGATGQARAVVNGVDISDHVSGVALVSRPREVTKLTIELIGEGPVEGLGEVSIIRSPMPMAQFLRGIDADELERVALERVGMGDSLTKTMLDLLAEWADPT